MKILPINYNTNVFKLNKTSCKKHILGFDSFCRINFKGNNDRFTPAKTLDEAVEYGKSNFKIKEYKGFNDDDLDTLNWFHEGLFNLKRIMKNTPFKAPDKLICFSHLDDDNLIEIEGNNLLFSKECFDNNKEFIRQLILNSNLSPEEEKERLSSNLTYLCQQYDMKYDNRFVMKSPFSLVYHEIGHIQHRYNLGNNLFKQITKRPKSKLSKSAQELVGLFLKNRKTVASRVSEYATESVLEFVAETFAGLCEGVEYDEKVMDLYRKLGGVIP